MLVALDIVFQLKPAIVRTSENSQLPTSAPPIVKPSPLPTAFPATLPTTFVAALPAALAEILLAILTDPGNRALSLPAENPVCQ